MFLDLEDWVGLRRPAEYTDQAFVSTGEFEPVFDILRT